MTKFCLMACRGSLPLLGHSRSANLGCGGDLVYVACGYSQVKEMHISHSARLLLVTADTDNGWRCESLMNTVREELDPEQVWIVPG